MSDLEKGLWVKLLLDSVNPNGYRLTTWLLKYPRIIHAEMLTHRVFSRCSSSSRAIPVERLIQKVLDDPAMPVSWGKNRKGMQALEELGEQSRLEAEDLWLCGRDEAASVSARLAKIGVHKQLANRPIEPWMHMVVVLSTTTLSNFRDLRDHPDAQPEIAAVARGMSELLLASAPKKLEFGAWHIPFVRPEEEGLDVEVRKKIAVARCARASYVNFEGTTSVEQDVELHDRLLAQRPLHASPLEHVAMSVGMTGVGYDLGNFEGWLQYRKTIPDEAAVHERWIEDALGKWREIR